MWCWFRLFMFCPCREGVVVVVLVVEKYSIRTWMEKDSRWIYHSLSAQHNRSTV
jgi:hypothetical protein